MAFNITNLFNTINNNANVSNNINNAGQADSGQNVNNGQTANSKEVIETLKNMMEGDILSGLVTDINNDNITLRLNNGQQLLARLAQNQLVQIGQNMTFLLENNITDTIILKPLMSDGQQAYMINNALGAAGYPSTEENVNLIKELINMNMPVDTDTISEMMKNTVHFPEADINTIANLMKLEIPVTSDNIAQFEAYKSYEHSIMGELNNIGQDISSTVAEFINSSEYDKGISILDNTINTLYQTGSGETAQNSEQIYNSSDGVVKLSDNQDNAQKAAGVDSQQLNSYMDKDSLGQLVSKISDTFGSNAQNIINAIKDGNLSTKELLMNINELLKNSHSKVDAAGLINSKEYGALLKQMTAETMMLTPAAVAEENSIKNFYKRLKSSIDNITDNLQKSAQGSSLAKDMSQIKSNIDFMNDLNKNMTFVQLPVKFSESAGNGDLYVFTNKKALKNGTDKVSALLHLDMDNLGPMDIYVNLSGKNVSTNFCLESEEMLDFVYSNIDKLNERLTKLGYITKFEMKLTQDNQKGIDFVDDFINKDNPSVKISQYVFDIKA